MTPAATWVYVRSQRGGDEGTRTLNPRRAKAVLYQLSYVPGSRRAAIPGSARPAATQLSDVVASRQRSASAFAER
jgi:hypothetical protein